MRILKICILSCFVIIAFAIQIKAQISKDWSRSYDPGDTHNQGANDVATDESGSVYVLGYTSRGYNGTDVALAKYDADGNFKWAKSYDGLNENNSDIGKSLTTFKSTNNIFIYTASDISISGYGNYAGIAKYDSSGNLHWAKNYQVGINAKVQILRTDITGNIYIAGGTGATPFLIKMTSAGDTSWVRYLPVPAGYVNSVTNDIAIDSAGNVYGTGKSSLPGNGNDDLITFKYNSAGILQWSKFYMNGFNNDYGNAITLSKAGFLYVTGGSDPSNFQPDIVTLKYNTLTGDTIWVKRYNGVTNGPDQARDIEIDNNENIFITGQIDGAVYSGDLAVIKYNSSGVLQWLRKFAGASSLEDYGKELEIDTAGNVYVAGIARHNFGIQYIGIKYNNSGDSLWTRLYNAGNNVNETVTAMALDKNLNLIIAGDCNALDMGIVKISSAGALQWIRIFTGAQLVGDYTNSIATDKNGNIYIAGKSRVNQYGDQFTIVKYNPSGNQLWYKSYGIQLYDSYDEAKAIVIDSAGYVYVTGTSFSRFSNLTKDFLTLKLDTAGNLLWYKTFNGSGNNDDDAKAIAIDNSGNVLVTGLSRGVGTSENYCTVKYNSAGTEMWSRYYNGPANGADYAYDVATDYSGNVYVTGQSAGLGTSDDIATIKYNPAGVQQWVQRLNGNGNGTDIGRTIELDHVGNVYVSGMTYNSVSKYSSVLIKYANDASGTFRWGLSESNSTADVFETANSIKLDSSKSKIYMTGTLATNADNSKYLFTAKYDSSGYRIYKQPYVVLGSNNEITPSDMILDKDQNVYIATQKIYNDGTPPEIGVNTYDSAFTLKYGFQSGFKFATISPDAIDIIAINKFGRIFIGGGIYDSTLGTLMSVVQFKKQNFELTLNMLLQGFYNSGTNNMIPDTVTVYLRYPQNLIKVDSAKAVINSSGTGVFKFSSIALNEDINYLAEIRHRNSIETWGALTFKFPLGNAVYTLYSSANQAYGSNQIQADATPLRFAIYGGDVNQNGSVDLTDLINVYNDAAGFVTGYKITDVTGDNITDLTDVVLTSNNAGAFVAKVTP